MEKARYLFLNSWFLALLLLLGPGDASGLEECFVPTVPGVVEDLDGWMPGPILKAEKETIEPGGSVNLWVEGGCPPFIWSVTGNGYTLSQTFPGEDSRMMTLNCSGGT
ncbi:MAG: hypothetical protein JRH06_05310 [Deltaproteobacteria bacterium]|nr:hypothetical protein [Deltaproteobacteria bacterium]MBW2136955.1 hypothetical protein [Deltaproteobacteria bacterium]